MTPLWRMSMAKSRTPAENSRAFFRVLLTAAIQMFLLQSCEFPQVAFLDGHQFLQRSTF